MHLCHLFTRNSVTTVSPEQRAFSPLNAHVFRGRAFVTRRLLRRRRIGTIKNDSKWHKGRKAACVPWDASREKPRATPRPFHPAQKGGQRSGRQPQAPHGSRRGRLGSAGAGGGPSSVIQGGHGLLVSILVEAPAKGARGQSRLPGVLVGRAPEIRVFIPRAFRREDDEEGSRSRPGRCVHSAGRV